MGLFLASLGIFIFFTAGAMEEEPRSLRSLAISFISKHPELVEKAQSNIPDIQTLIEQKIIDTQIKSALFTVKIKKSKRGSKIRHQGVCGLETMEKPSNIITVGCDGTISVCDEQDVEKCDVINTDTNWCCATMICEPPTLCLGDLGGTVGYLGLKDKEPKNLYKAHEQPVNGLSLSPDQCQLISCSNDAEIKLWDVASNKRLATFAGHTAAVKNAFSIRAHQKIISAAVDHTIRVWDIETAKEEQRHSLRETIFPNVNFFRLARHPHEQVAISGLNNGMVALWDIRKNRHVECLRGHTQLVSALHCSPCGNYLASGSWDGKVRLWDFRMLGCSAILAFHKEDWVQNVTSLNNFNTIVSGARDGRVKTWDISSLLAIDRMNNLKITAAKAALIKAERPITDDERSAMLARITQVPTDEILQKKATHPE